MRFAEPTWLLAGAAGVTILFLLLARAERLRARALRALMGSRLLSASTGVPSRARRWVRVGVASAAVAMGFGALARPQRGTHWEAVARQGVDLLLVVDTSKSMDADDVKPTRLTRTKLAIRDLVERFPGDRIGLVAFAGDAFLASPMTLDHGALLDTLDAFDTSVVTRGGTDIGRAIDVAAATLADAPAQQKVAVLLTDGEDLEGHGLDAARRAAAAGVAIDTVGVGTRAGEMVPARDAKGAIVGVVRGEDGAPVRSRLDEAGLGAIAAAAHGTYRPLGQDGKGLDRLYDESLAGLLHVDASSRTHRVYDEWFEIPLALSLLGLVLDALLGWRRSTTRPRGAGVAAVAAAVAGLVFMAPRGAHASVETAANAYAAGRFDDAAREYEAERARHPADPRLAFNAGDAAYRAGQYEAADAAFEQAMAKADPALQERVLYNQGNTHYRMGAALQAGSRDQAIEQWKKAITEYDGALALAPADADARFNRDFVKRKLAELEQQQQAQKPPKDSDPKDKKGGADKDQKKDGKGGDDPKKDGKGGDDPKKDGNGGGPGKDQGKGDKGDQGKDQGKGDNGDHGKDQGKGDKGGPGEDQGKDAKGGPGDDQDKGAPPRPGGDPGEAQGAKQAAGKPGDSGDARGARGSEDGQAAQPGQLSAHDARALLRSLRGEERHGVSHGSGTQKPSDDAPGKDW